MIFCVLATTSKSKTDFRVHPGELSVHIPSILVLFWNFNEKKKKSIVSENDKPSCYMLNVHKIWSQKKYLAIRSILEWNLLLLNSCLLPIRWNAMKKHFFGSFIMEIQQWIAGVLLLLCCWFYEIQLWIKNFFCSLLLDSRVLISFFEISWSFWFILYLWEAELGSLFQ